MSRPGRQPGVNDYSFQNVPSANIPRSTFDRSHGHKTTFDAGWLVPIFIDEALPGDTFNLKMSGFGRLATPIHPIMDNMYLETFFFAVPYRLVWDNWEKFNGQQDNPGDSTDYLIPTTPNLGTVNSQSLLDYMGIPTNIDLGNTRVSALPFRAYQLIWNEWFRDQNLQDSIVIPKNDGPDPGGDLYLLRKRGKRHDYFTSCLPWPQKGEEVLLPLGNLAPVYGIGLGPAADWNNTPAQVVEYDRTSAWGQYAIASETGHVLVRSGTDDPEHGNPDFPAVYADLSNATAATINDLREAFQIQKLYERDARGGTRYTEIIQSHFGVTSDDARLQRPEYLGGGRSPVNIAEVAQTSQTDTSGPEASPQGNLAATGRIGFSNHGFTKSFTEHCILIGLMCVRADLTYQQGINRMWHRSTRFDFYWPSLSHLGEQAVLNKELFANGGGNDELVFGYQERYAEYRYKPSMITGKMRSSDPQSLDVWHLSQEFSSRPLLDSEFIEENPPIDRVIAVADEPHFLFDSWFTLRCARPMPTYAVPGLIDHF